MLPDSASLPPTTDPSGEERSIETVVDCLRAALAGRDPDHHLERLVGAALGDEAATYPDLDRIREPVHA
jgi:hypothetical protein